ncbi:MAG: SpoIIE family protein phosphatase [Ruminiclostridium sp.]|nr:SpoIIE family protein phosphatase [Ruminiclostridium sp.]
MYSCLRQRRSPIYAVYPVQLERIPSDADQKMFGEERMTEALDSAGNASLCDLLGSVKSSIDAFVGGAPQFDDITMLALRYLGNK